MTSAEQTKALVQNASSEKQVKEAGNKEQMMLSQRRKDMAHVLSSIEGRRFIWRLLGQCRTFSSIHETSAKIHYNSGQQDIGFQLLREIDAADAEMFFKMRNENLNKEI